MKINFRQKKRGTISAKERKKSVPKCTVAFGITIHIRSALILQNVAIANKQLRRFKVKNVVVKPFFNKKGRLN